MVDSLKRDFTLRDWIWLIVLLMGGLASYVKVDALVSALKEGFDNHEGRITELEKQEFIRQGYEKALLQANPPADGSD